MATHLVVHPVHACDPVHLLPGLQAAEWAMVLFQHHHRYVANSIADDLIGKKATSSDPKASALAVSATLSA